jgi:hypothetical protein
MPVCGIDFWVLRAINTVSRTFCRGDANMVRQSPSALAPGMLGHGQPILFRPLRDSISSIRFPAVKTAGYFLPSLPGGLLKSSLQRIQSPNSSIG